MSWTASCPNCRRSVLVALLAITVLSIAIAAIALWPEDQAHFLAVPVPNGYDDIMQAAHLIGRSELLEFSRRFDLTYVSRNPEHKYFRGVERLQPGELRGFVEAHEKSLLLLQRGLQRPSVMPLRDADRYVATHSCQIMALRDLRFLLGMKARLHEMEGRLDLVVKTYLDSSRFAFHATYGGLMFDRVYSYWLSLAAVEQLHRLRPLLSHTLIKEIVATLSRLDESLEPLADVEARNRLVLPEQRRTFLETAAYCLLVKSDSQKCREEDTKYRSLLRLFVTDFALFLYKRGNRTYPAKLAELVPDYLRRLPEDPFTETDTPLMYQRSGQSYLLYSVGHNGEDDGGDAEEDVLLPKTESPPDPNPRPRASAGR